MHSFLRRAIRRAGIGRAYRPRLVESNEGYRNRRRRSGAGGARTQIMNVEEIQRELRNQKLDGWLFFDHHQRDPLAYRVLGFTPARHVTRRWYYLIPAEGEPAGLVHNIEFEILNPLPGVKARYSSWQEQTAGMRTLLAGRRRIAMQYSPQCAIPLVSM